MCEIAANPGRIRIYTSWWPKNQNKCWNRTGSPPPAGSKKEVLMLRSVSNTVIAPARIGRDNNRRITVSSTAHTNSEIRSGWMPFERILMIVVLKLIAPKINEAPARCRERIVKSTDGPLWAMFLARGGYTVHPVPTPLSASIDSSESDREKRSSHRLRL